MDPLTLPDGFNPEHIPAIVVTSDDGRAALCWHPLGAEHPNAQATITRLVRRRIAVLNAPATPRAA